MRRADQRTAARENRREQILDATLILAGNRGYRGFSLQDVAERCSITKQGVMHYFPTKERLLVSLLDERDASIEADLLAQLEAGGFDDSESAVAKRAAFRVSLAEVIGHLQQTPDVIRLHVVLRAEAISADHPARDYFLRRDRETLRWLADRMEPFSPAPLSSARHILALMLGLQEQWLQENQSFDLSAEWRSALATLLPE